MKKIHIVLAVSAILLIALFSRPVSLSAMEKANAKADISGKCGENISYNLDTTRGILTLTGSGETYNYTRT